MNRTTFNNSSGSMFTEQLMARRDKTRKKT